MYVFIRTFFLIFDCYIFTPRRSWGGHENAKMVFAKLNCNVLNIEIMSYIRDEYKDIS